MRKWIISSILFSLMVFMFLPEMASSKLGKRLVLRSFEKKTESQLEADSVKFSWFGPQKFNDLKWRHKESRGTIEEFQIDAPFWSFSGPFKLINGSMAYKGGSIERIEGKVEGNEFSLTGISFQGHIALKGHIYSKRHFHIEADIKQFPTVVLDKRLDKLMGPGLDLKGTVSLKNGEGLIDLTASSAYLKTHLTGGFTEEAIALHQPLTAKIHLTPELSSLLLKDANPLFLNGISSEEPVTLWIDPKGFYLPLDASLKNLKIQEATLSLGKVICKNGQSLQTILSLIKGDEISKSAQMTAWFSPVQFKVNQGFLKLGRMDALIDGSLHICTWGNIDLIKDKVGMYLGLPASTLSAAFGIENLASNYVFKVKIGGTTQQPELVKGPAAAKLSALIAANQAPKQGILGGIADFVSRSKKDPNVPPANRPFPWEK